MNLYRKINHLFFRFKIVFTLLLSGLASETTVIRAANIATVGKRGKRLRDCRADQYGLSANTEQVL